jgi:hypothetical protein
MSNHQLSQLFNFDQMELLLFLLLVIFKGATLAFPTLDCPNFEFGSQI